MSALANIPLAASKGSFLIKPSVGLALWTLLVFGLTMVLLAKLAFPRISQALERRQRTIEESIDTAQRTREEADRILAEYRERLTEARAREQGVPVRTGYTDLITSARGWIHKAGNEGFIKLVADADRDVLVGATSAGPSGGEVLSALTVAVHAEVPLATLRSMMYAYPTFHRAIEAALADLG